MPNFHYRATDPEGRPASGELAGADRDQVAATLLARGLSVESLTEGDRSPAVAGAGGSRRELVELVEQLASLTRSGLPLPSGLRAAGREVASASLRSTFFGLADRIESGGDLGESLLATGRHLPAHLRGLIAAGTRSGRLADVLAEYVRGASLGSELRRVFWSTMMYPLFALAMVIGLVVFICTISIRAVDALVGGFPEMGQGTPSSVVILVTLAGLISEHGLQILVGSACLAVAAWLGFRFGIGPARRRRIVCSIPAVGPILRFISLAEFCHLLAMMVEADVPMPEAIDLAGSSVADADLAESCGRMRRAVEGGEPLSTAVKHWDSVPAGLGQLFRWSEDRRALPDALHLAGDMFESRARTQSSFAGSVLATSLLLLILWWVGFAIATLYLPLINMISRLSG